MIQPPTFYSERNHPPVPAGLLLAQSVVANTFVRRSCSSCALYQLSRTDRVSLSVLCARKEQGCDHDCLLGLQRSLRPHHPQQCVLFYVFPTTAAMAGEPMITQDGTDDGR